MYHHGKETFLVACEQTLVLSGRLSIANLATTKKKGEGEMATLISNSTQSFLNRGRLYFYPDTT